MLMLANCVRDLQTKEFRYEIAADIHTSEGILSMADGDLRIIGEKANNGLNGTVVYEAEDFLGFTADESGEVMLNVAPAVKAMVNMAKEKIGFSLPFSFGSFPEEMNISLDQIEMITGQRSESPFLGVSGGLLSVDGSYIAKHLKEYKNIPKKEQLLGEKAVYYRLMMDDGNVIIGIPTSSKEQRLSISIKEQSGTSHFVMDYHFQDVDSIEMPRESVSDETIKLIRQIWQMISG